MVSDFVRASVVVENGGLWSKIKRGLQFAFGHPIATGGVYIIGCVMSLISLAVYLVLFSAGTATTTPGVSLAVLLLQVIILVRIFFKLVSYASEATLYKENQIEVINVKLEILE